MKLLDGLFFPMLRSPARLMVEVESCQHFEATHRVGFDSRPWERNADVVVFQYTLTGEGRVQFKDQDLAQHPGQAFLIHTEPTHRYFLPEHSEAWRFVSFTFRGESVVSWAKEMIQEHGIQYQFDYASEVVQAVEALYQRVSREVMVDPFALSAQVYQLTMLIQQSVVPDTMAHSMHSQIQAAISYIHQHYRKSISLDDIAVKVGLSRFYFARLFKQQTGSTIRDYLEQVRVQHAKQMLLDRSLPIADIAALVGFLEQAYFSNVFRESTGLSPSEYRKTSRAIGYLPR